MSGSMPAGRSGARITRRQGLIGLTALLPIGALASCSGDTPPASAPTPTTAATPQLSAQVAAEEAALVSLYDSAIAALPAGQERTRSALELLRGQHADHLSALGGSPPPPTAQNPGGEAAEPAPVSIATLLEAERKAARDRIRSCVDASDPELGRTLAFIAASEASHVPFLRDLS